MQFKFTLSLLASAILLSGCSFTKAPEVGLVEPASHFDDRMLDSLGSQKYAEQQMLYARKVNELEHQLDQLEQKRRDLDSAIGVSNLEVGAGSLSASDNEALRMSDFAAATQESQARIALEEAALEASRSNIENDRDQKLLEAELDAQRRLSALELRYSSSIQNSQSETDRARLESDLAIEKAKAKAQHRKATIEAEVASEALLIEQSYQSKISSAKASAEISGQVVSQAEQAQRIKVALANADNQRRVKDEIERHRNDLASIEASRRSETQPIVDEISRLNEQIIGLQGRLSGIEAGYQSKMTVTAQLIASLEADLKGLDEVQAGLINAPAMPVASVSPDLSRLENELAQAKAAANINKANRLADVDRQLAVELDSITAGLTLRLARLDVAVPATARVEQVAAESQIKADLAVKQTQIKNEARSDLAEVRLKTELAKSNVVAPVLTNRAVYAGTYGTEAKPFAARESANAARQVVAQAKALEKPAAAPRIAKAEPLVVTTSFEPATPKAQRVQVDDVVIASGVSAAGAIQPLVIAPSGTSYSVVYRYEEKGSADKFMAYLRAYGITDFTYVYSEKLGQHILFMGKYDTKERAGARVSFLNKTTSTANASIIENDF